jgi:glucosamine-6-phosphate deaminase
VAATGTSQFELLDALTSAKEIDWPRVTMFHLDEYIGIPANHPASFRRYLRERFIDKVPLGSAVLINGEENPATECRRLNDLISRAPIDLLLCGIGENGHLAFNDPPANFTTARPFIVVSLDRACRRQQIGEGWFPSLAAVPERAISMSIRQIMAAQQIICVAPGRRKATPVRDCLEGDISPLRPSSILRSHPRCDLYLDRDSAALLHES